MANEKNLRTPSTKEAREMQKKSAKKRQENRVKERIFAESIKQMLTDEDWAEIIRNAIERAKDSDKAFEVVRDTLGQKPKDQVSLETETPFKIEIEVLK